MSAIYKISFYLGSGQEGQDMREILDRLAKEPEFKNVGKLLTHCVAYTLSHDPGIKKILKGEKPNE